MKLTAPKKALVAALSQCIGYTGKTPQIATHVLFDADGDSVTLRATDMRLSFEAKIACMAETPGKSALPARDLLDRIKAMADGPVTISVDKTAASVRGPGSRRFSLFALPAEDFPKAYSTKGEVAEMRIAAGVLREMTDSVFGCIANDETRPHVNSMLVQPRAGKLRFVSTDGHRLAFNETLCADGIEFLIPRKALDLLRKLLDSLGLADEVALSTDKVWLRAVVGDALFSCMLTEAVFPPYEQVIPKSFNSSALVPRAALSASAHAVAISANDRTSGIVLDFGEKRVRVTAESPEKGNAEDEVPIDLTGKGGRIGFRGSYVEEAMGVFDSETVRVEMSGELDPMVVRPESGDGQLVVLMPMRI